MKKILSSIVAVIFALSVDVASAAESVSLQDLQERVAMLEAAAVDAAKPEKKTPAWNELISLRGYIQLRYNRLLENNENLRCEQCDKSVGANGGFFVRRARLVLSGDVNERVYLYMQPDFATDSSATALHFTQLRDIYADLALDPAKEFRFRVGQSKVPYGFENLQSSQNRLALDRADPLNSAVSNERDLGVFFYWAPEEIRKRFAGLVSSGLKGSGDYGVFGIGAYNGQTANRPESNDSQHLVARLSYPFRTEEGQVIEAGLQGYMGRFIVPSTSRTAGVGGPFEIHDRRAAASFVVYPQPLGFQAEYNFGVGPEFEARTRSIQPKHLHGGYAQLMFLRRIGGQVLTPFVRAQYYQGGKKQETDARRYMMRQIEGGVEWQVNKSLELTALYSHEDRAYEDQTTLGNRQQGGRVRLQLQINY